VQAAYYEVPFYFVRTKCDQDVDSTIRSAKLRGETLDPKDAFEVMSTYHSQPARAVARTGTMCFWT
jgi:hypothetical protein